MLVTSPRRDSIEEARFFQRRLVESDFPFAGAVANRVNVGAEAGAAGGDLEKLLGVQLAVKVEDAAEAQAGLAERDRQNLDQLKRRLGRKPLIEVPLLPGDVHDLDGLRRMGEHLFQTGAE